MQKRELVRLAMQKSEHVRRLLTGSEIARPEPWSHLWSHLWCPRSQLRFFTGTSRTFGRKLVYRFRFVYGVSVWTNASNLQQQLVSGAGNSQVVYSTLLPCVWSMCVGSGALMWLAQNTADDASFWRVGRPYSSTCWWYLDHRSDTDGIVWDVDPCGVGLVCRGSASKGGR